jgi:threonylcarbamoyladenosine tRNA methylthiotransferase MtaB
LLNTCTVTHIADRKSRNLLRSAYRKNPDALIVAVGCYAERAREELSNIQGVSIVIGNRDKARVVEIVGSLQRCAVRRIEDNGKQRVPFRTRTMVKIQEGCSQPCTFCVVPRVRGREVSRPEEEIVAEIKARVAEGYKEVVLTGTRIGSYSHDGGLVELTSRILKETDVQRLRLSSLEPEDITPELLRLWEDRRLCPHIHMPLQSGSESVLRRMKRAYSISDYERAASLAREAIPNLALTSDIMVAFPGESDDEFEESYRFCERMGFAAIHVFPYSARPGTRAAQLPDSVPDNLRSRRTQLMLDLGRRCSANFRERFLGQYMNVLWEGIRDGVWFGLSENYLRVFTCSGEQLANHLLETRVVGHYNGGLRGELIRTGAGVQDRG